MTAAIIGTVENGPYPIEDCSAMAALERMTVVSPAAENVTRLVVANDYQWIGNPRAAGFAVYVDGGRAGVASLGDRLSVPVDPGAHVLRVRLWYFLSPRVKVDIQPGEVRRFSADIPRTLPWWRKFRGLVDPFHWLSLEEVGKL